MQVEVRLPGVLADDAGGRRILIVDLPEGASVAVLLDALAGSHPMLERRVRDEAGSLRRYVNVYLDQDDVRACGGAAAVIPAGAVVSVLPSVAGG
jgi:sulfur-carrier protein